MRMLSINNYQVQLLSGKNGIWASVNQKIENIRYSFARRFDSEEEAIQVMTRFLNIKKVKR